MEKKFFLTIISFIGLVQSINSYASPIFESGGEKIQLQELRVGINATGWNSMPAIGDFDKDGLDDLIIGDRDGFIWFYKNSGSRNNPRFNTGEKIKDTNGNDIQVFCHWASPAITDWNNDHTLDLIVGNSNGTIYRYMGNGNGQVQAGSSTVALKSILRSVYFVDLQTGWAVGNNGIILYTTDGGLNWTFQSSKSLENLQDIYFTSENEGWAVGSKGEMRHFYNGMWEIPTGSSSTTGTSATNLNAINKGWAVGDEGTILQFKAGSWQVGASVTTKADLSSIKFADARYGWAVGKAGTIIQIDANPAGSPTATLITPVTSVNLNDISLIDANNGWAVGDNGTFLQLSAGVWTVVQIPVPVNNNLQSVFLTDANSGIAVGQNGIIFQLLSGVWTQVTSNVTDHLNSVFFANASTGWIVGNNGTILYTADGGTTWAIQSLSINVGKYSTPYLFDLDEDNIKDMIIGDEHGYVWFFKNQGSDNAPQFDNGFRISLGTQAVIGTWTNFLDVGQYARPVVTDWDGDGVKDLIVGNHTGNVYFYKGHHNTAEKTTGLIRLPIGNKILWFESQPKILTVANRQIDVGNRAAPSVVDWNNDGGTDLLIGNEDGTIYLLLNIHTWPGEIPEFNIMTKVEGTPRDMDISDYSVPVIVDWNNDNRKDLIVGDQYGFVTLFLNEGTNREPVFTGGFRFQGSYTLTGTAIFITDIDVGNFSAPFPVDWNNDGKKDLLVGDANGQLQLFINLGSDDAPIFGTSTIIKSATGIVQSNIDVGQRAIPFVVDWDNDGRKDIIIGNEDGRVLLFLNIGTDQSPVFGSSTLLKNQQGDIDVGGFASPRVFDWDKDNNKDLIVGDMDGYVHVFLNIGNDSQPVLDKDVKVQINGIDIDNGKFATPFITDWDENCTPDLIIGDIDGFITLYRSKALIELYITKSVDKTFANIGDILTYTITYGNRGQNGASKIEIIDEIPEIGIVTVYEPNSAKGNDVSIHYFIGNTETFTQSSDITKIKWSREFLEAGKTGQKVSFQVRVIGSSTNGTVSNFATINSIDSISPLDSIEASTQIQPFPPLPDFSQSIINTSPVGNVKSGSVLMYEIVCKNSGNQTATNILVTDMIDIANLTNITNISNGGSYTTGTITWQIPSIKQGYSTKLSFQATVKSPLPNGTRITSQASIISDQTPTPVQIGATNTVLSPDSQSNDWPMFHFGPNHTGYEPSEALNLPLRLKWRLPLKSSGFSSPIVADNMVYLGSNDGKVYAIGAEKGDIIGRYSTGSPIISTPAVADSALYVANQQGVVFSLTANPSLNWSYLTESSINQSSIVIVNGVLYIGLTDGRLCAINTADGHLLWAYQTGMAIESSPAIDDGLVYFGSNDKKVYCVSASNGEFKWAATFTGQVKSSPAVINRVVYVGCDDNKLYALDATNGSLKWSYTTGNMVRSSPAVADDSVYFGSIDEQFYALTINGNLKWKANINSPINSSPAVANGVVYFGSDNKKVYGLDVKTGKEVWSYIMDNPVYSSPAIADGNLYIASNNGNLYAFSDIPDFTDGSVNKITVSPSGNIKSGQEIIYTIFYKNTGNATANNLSIIVNTTGSLTNSGNIIIGTVSPGQEGQVSVKAIATTTSGNITGQAVFNWGSNSFTTNMVSNNVVPGNLIAATKTVSPAGTTVTPGSNLTYTIEFANRGNISLDNLIITDSINEYLTDIQPNNQGQFDSGSLIWRIKSLSSGAKAQVSFKAKTKDKLKNGTLISSNQTTIVSDQTEPFTITANTLIVNSPDFSLSIKTGAATCFPGSTLIYTINYRNTGSQTATGVKIIDTLDSNLILDQTNLPAFASYTQNNRTIIWQIGQIKTDGQGTISFKVVVKSPLNGGTTIKNQAIIQSDQIDGITNDVITTVQALPDFTQSRMDVEPKNGIPANKILSYTITYKNTGSMDVKDVVITDVLSQNLSVSTITSTSEVIAGNAIVNFMNYDWTRQFNGSPLDSKIIITTDSGRYESLDMGSYPSLQELIKDINNNQSIMAKISYNPDVDKFTLVGSGSIKSIEQTGSNPFFSAIKLPTGNYCTGTYTNQIITWDIGEVKSGQAGSVTFRAMVINNPATVSNQATISVTGGLSWTTNPVYSTVDTTSPATTSVKIIEGNIAIPEADEDADLDGNYIVFWEGWDDIESGIARYELQETSIYTGTFTNSINWTTLSNNISAATSSYQVSNRIKGKTYFYRIRAMNGAGLWSDYAGPSDGIRVVDQLRVFTPGSSTKITYPNHSPVPTSNAPLVSGSIALFIPANTFSTSTTLTIANISIPESDINSAIPTISAILPDSSYEILALCKDYYGRTLSPNQPITLTLPYYDTNTNRKDESSYRIYWFNNDHWEIVTGEQKIYSDTNLITAYPKNLGIFGVAAPSTKLGEVIVWPNPFYPYKKGYEHKEIKFKWGGGSAHIWVYNVAGELVFEKDEETSPFKWDAKNNDGEELASGVYIYILENKSGEKADGKIAIVK